MNEKLTIALTKGRILKEALPLLAHAGIESVDDITTSRKLVFETNQYLKGWDGTYKGKPQPNGVYVWIVSGTDRDKKKVSMQGTVMLVR